MSMHRPQHNGRDRATTIGLILSLLAAILWVVYGLTDAPPWLLIVAVVYSMLVGGWWAFGRQLLGDGDTTG